MTFEVLSNRTFYLPRSCIDEALGQAPKQDTQMSLGCAYGSIMSNIPLGRSLDTSIPRSAYSSAFTYPMPIPMALDGSMKMSD